MKRNITLSLDSRLLKQVRAFAAQRGTSISAMLADELQRLITAETIYDQAKAKALAHLRSPFRLGGAKMDNREALHDRQDLR